MEYLHDLVLLLMLAKVLGLPLRRAGIHPIVGHVLAGVILGPYVLGLVDPSPELGAIANVALLLLLFYTGLTTDFRELRRRGYAVLLMGASGVAATFILSLMMLHYILGIDLSKSLFISVVLSNTATETVAATIARLGGLDIKALVVGASLVDDIIAVFAISIVASMGAGGADILYLSMATIAFITLSIAVSSVLVKHAKIFYARLSRDYLLFASISIILALLLAILAREAGLSELIGAYMAGLIIGRGREFHDPLIRTRVILSEFIADLSTVLEALFIPIFFTYVGLLFTPWRISIPLYVIGLTAAVVGKVLGCTPIAYKSLGDARKGLAAGVIMTGRGALETALLKLGLDQGIIGLSEYTTVIMIALSTVILSPLLYSMVIKRVATV